MVSGLFIPLLAVLIKPNNSSKAAVGSMISGGGTSLVLIVFNPALPFGLEPIAFAILASMAVFLLVSVLDKTKRR
jgi:SSS family solute:Na+ symporter